LTTHSLKTNLHLAMSLSKYKDFIGIDYERPHGCFKLVAQVFKEVYGIDLGKPEEGLDEDAESRDKTAVVRKSLAEKSVEVSEPQEGDVVIIRSRPWHIGLIIGDGLMLHNYSRSSNSCIEEYNSMRWKDRIEGFYRYKGFQ